MEWEGNFRDGPLDKDKALIRKREGMARRTPIAGVEEESTHPPCGVIVQALGCDSPQLDSVT